jgi:GNAT superfamily N-acetyltransferase
MPPTVASLAMMIRPARPDDAPAIAALLAELGYPSDADLVRERLMATDLVLLSVEPDSGLIALQRIPRLAEGGCIVRVTALVVAATSRGRSVGRMLLLSADEVARDWGADLVEVSCGRRPERDAAHRLYRTAGYEDVADVSVVYRKTL